MNELASLRKCLTLKNTGNVGKPLRGNSITYTHANQQVYSLWDLSYQKHYIMYIYVTESQNMHATCVFGSERWGQCLKSNKQIGVGVGTNFIEYTYLYAASLTSIGSCF